MLADNSLDTTLAQSDIETYLQQHANKELLRFITCGSVDDGKSTLIGRLLHDSKLIYEDQLAAVKRDSQRKNSTTDELDLSLLVDGLQAEREQGITIDVAYRYFSTDKRKFIIADTPGHEQYTRNMATGASTSDLAVILVDAEKGVQPQTRRHSFIVSLLGIKHVIVAVNKMDLVGFEQARYKEIQNDYLKLAGHLDIPDIHFVPISALKGDNIVTRSDNTPWFRGRTLLEYLETLEIKRQRNGNFRFAVQYVNRPNSQFRGYAGTIASGEVKVGDTIRVLPSGQVSTIKSIVVFEGEIEKASAPQAVTLTLNDELDISRGDVIAEKDALPHMSARLRAKVVWMHQTALEPDKDYLIKIGTKTTIGRVDKLLNKTDVNSLEELPSKRLELNEIGTVDMSLQEAVVFDRYKRNSKTGAFIMIDRLTNATVGAGMIAAPLIESSDTQRKVGLVEKFVNRLVRRLYPHWGVREV